MADAASKEIEAQHDAAREKALEKTQIIKRICILSARKKALEELIDDERNRLRVLMDEDNDDRITVEEGMASFGAKRRFSVKDPAKLVELIGVDEIVAHFKPTASLVDGAAKAKIQILKAIDVTHDRTFTVERARTKEMKERMAQIIEETKQAAAAKADEVAMRLRVRSGPPEKEKAE